MKINGKPDGGGGGEAIWGGITGTLSNQTDLMNKFNDYATQTWVEGQGYTSDQDPELAPLYNKLDGYLRYKLLIAGKSNKYIPSGAASGTYGTRTVFNINGDIIGFTYRNTTYGGNGMIYKFNRNTFTFDELIQGVGYDSTERPMWTDNTGRVYYGISYTVDLTTGEFTSWDFGVNSTYYKTYQSSIHNIVKFNGSIYLITPDKGKAFKFYEPMQQFIEISYLSDIADQNWYRNVCEYEDKILVKSGSKVYELAEITVDGEVTGVSFSETAAPYFPMTYYNVDDEAEVNITISQIFKIKVNNVTQYVHWNTAAKNHVYQLVNNVWTPIPNFTLSTPASGSGAGAIQDDLMFGYAYGTADSVMVWNFNDTYETYGWDTSVDSRLAALEEGYGDALSISNNILG